MTLRDITFEGSVGFPISRIEKLETVQRLLAEQTEKNVPHEELTPNISRPQRTENTVLYPEIPMSERHNFRSQTINSVTVRRPKSTGEC